MHKQSTTAPLPSWNNGPTRQSILDFVADVTAEGRPSFVPVPERIAVFDNDGTLWCEQPMPVEGFFALDRVRELAEKKPALCKQDPFKAVIEHDQAALAKLGRRGIVELLGATHSGMTPAEFDQIAKRWFAAARHPRIRRLFTACTYRPMLELLALLHANEFAVFVVSGGGADFMRAYVTGTYGIASDRVIGSSGKTRVEVDGTDTKLIKLPELDTFDDREQKPIDIHRHIGKRPIFAFGNSDGDLPMLRYAASGPGTRMALLLHHDDAAREYAYDRDFAISRLDTGLQEAETRGWLVSMKHDWSRVFA
jgi:hypothetical protein